MNRKQFIQLSALSAACLGIGTSAKAADSYASSLALAKADGFQKYPRNKLTFPQIDFGTQVFSKCGSWLIIDYVDRQNTHRIQIKTLRSCAITNKWDTSWAADLYEIVLLKNNTELKYQTTASPYNLELKTDAGALNITFSDNDTLFFEAQGIEVRLQPKQGFSWTYQVSTSELKVNMQLARMMNHIKTFAGTNLKIGETEKTGEKGATKDVVKELVFETNGNTSFALRCTQSDTLWDKPLTTYTQSYNSTKAEVDAWMDKMPAVPNKYFAAAQTAWYLLHAFQVAPAGRITRQTLLASKNSWLTKIWSWDHCFHAMALAKADTKLAWDQLFVMFDNQNANGSFPDALDDNGGHYNFVKPPVHGWTIKNIIETTGVEASMPYIKEAYEPLARWTEYWYIFRNDNKNGMCHYLHGNDSGWDNATAYDQGIPTEGADLAAYLVLQQQTLAYMAQLLGKPDEAKKWNEKADIQLKNLLKYAVIDNKFVSPLAATGKAASTQSLINYVPLILGKQLDQNILKTNFADLKPGGNYMTDYGLATEALNSPKYQYDGYWRGPIWAPPTYQIFWGAVNAGETDIARTLAERFCNLCALDNSFSENYDAPSGKAVQAPGVCWTPAVFILMASWLAASPNPS